MSLPALGAALTMLVPWPVVSSWLAQETTSSNGDVAAVVTLVAQLGLSAVFLWQWRDERGERRRTQEKLYDLIERMNPVVQASTATLERVQRGMTAQVERAAQAEPVGGLDDTVQRLESTIDEFTRALRDTRSGRQGDDPHAPS